MKNNQTYGRDIVAENYYDAIMQHEGKWVKEWNTQGYGQQNGTTHKEYRGQNQLNLFFEQLKRNSADPRWMTMTQIIKNNLRLEKGSKGAKVEYHSNFTERVKRDEAGKPILNEDGKAIKETIVLPFHVGKHATVFNGKNIIGIEPFKVPTLTIEQQAQIEQEKIRKLDAIMKNFQKTTGIEIKEIPSARACFIRGDKNQIVLPEKSQFQNIDAFYATAFHEIAHATAVLEDYERPANEKGSKGYAQEELIAETSTLLMMKEYNAIYEPQTIESESNVELNSFAYLKTWMESGSLSKDDFKKAFADAVVITQYVKSLDIERVKTQFQSEKGEDNTINKKTIHQNQEREAKENEEIEL